MCIRDRCSHVKSVRAPIVRQGVRSISSDWFKVAAVVTLDQCGKAAKFCSKRPNRLVMNVNFVMNHFYSKIEGFTARNDIES